MVQFCSLRPKIIVNCNFFTHEALGKHVRAFQIELEFGSVAFWGEEKTGVPEQKPTYGFDAGIWTRVTLVEGEYSHFCDTLAAQTIHGLYIGIETIFCCLLQQIARKDMDWNLKKLGQTFQVLMLCLPNKLSCMLTASRRNLFDAFCIALQEHLVYVLGHIVMTWPNTAISLWHTTFKLKQHWSLLSARAK